MPGPLALLRARAMARRAVPLALAAKRWWEDLDDADRERYKRQARDFADRGRQAVEARRGRGRRRR